MSMTPAPLQQLAALLDHDDVDAAIRAGLMTLDLSEAMQGPQLQQVLVARQRLQRAWDARARYQARDARLARIAMQRRERSRDAAAPAGMPAPAPTQSNLGLDASQLPMQPSGLPSAAAAALARAKARAGTRTPT